jgi:predicted transcriptional regulator
MPRDTVATSIRIPADLLSRYEDLAVALHRSRTALMIQALAEFLETGLEEELSLEEAITQADAGQFVPREEVDAFFAECGTPEEWETSRQEARRALGRADAGPV